MKRKVTGGVVVLLMVGMTMRAWGWGRWYDLRLRVTVVDDDGRAVEGAKVETVFDQGGGGWTGRPDRYARFEGLTDSNGEFGARAKTLGHVRIGVSKEGYYGWRRKIYFFRKGEKRDGEWGPYDPWVHGVTAILKRVERRIGMYVRTVETTVPSTGCWYGLDLMVGDWVEPYGGGKTSDIVIRIDGYWKGRFDNDATMRVRFLREGDGLIPVLRRDEDPIWHSSFTMPRYAPQEGYVRERRWRKMKRYGGGRDEWANDYNERMNYIFRIRSQRDREGRVTDAYYGKIEGDIYFGGATSNECYLRFGPYYLNPVPKDRNLEYGWNLLKEGGEGR